MGLNVTTPLQFIKTGRALAKPFPLILATGSQLGWQSRTTAAANKLKAKRDITEAAKFPTSEKSIQPVETCPGCKLHVNPMSTVSQGRLTIL